MGEFLTKDDFFDYVLDNRDRQDDNKQEIIDTLQTAIQVQKIETDKDIDDVGGRVTKLEDDNRKQNRVATGITALGVFFYGILAYLK